LILEAHVPASPPLGVGPVWVSLREWHILQQPVPHILAYDTLAGDTLHLVMARGLAARLHGRLTVVTVADDTEDAVRRRSALETRLESLNLPDAEARVRTGDAADEILAEQAEGLYAFTVVSADLLHEGRVGRGSNVVRDLLTASRVPILLTRGTSPTLERMLICTAAGEPGKDDVRVGGRLARQVGAAVTLLYVDTGTPSDRVRGHLARAEVTLRSLDVTGELKVRTASSPAAGILAEVELGAYDLVVVGGHGPTSRSLFGRDDVTAQVVTASPCSVLVVPAWGGG
jgi:nucleotide-binding universal stress UspA family protein